MPHKKVTLAKVTAKNDPPESTRKLGRQPPEGLEAEAAKTRCLGQRVYYVWQIFYINHPRRVFTRLDYCNGFSAITYIYFEFSGRF